MRLAILADIHANLPALEAVLADVERQAVDGIAVAGDMAGGAQPREVVSLLRSRGAWMIRGNHEDYLLACAAGEAAETWQSRQWATLTWACRRLAPGDLGFLASLAAQRAIALPGTDPIRVVHGSPRRVAEILCPDGDPAALHLFRQAGLLPVDGGPPCLEQTLAAVEEPVLICGHSHIPWLAERAGRLALNPGSVGAPINGDPRAQYALLTWQAGRWRATFRAVPYDVGRVRAAFEATGFLAAGDGFARACQVNVETGWNVPGSLVAYAYRLAAAAGRPAQAAVPDEIWERAVATFDWEAAARGQARFQY